MLRFILLTAFGLLLVLPGQAQMEQKMDSLRNIIAQQEGEAKVPALQQLISILARVDPDQGLEAMKELEAIANQYNWKHKNLMYLEHRGLYYFLKRQYDSLYHYSQRGIEEAEQLQIDTFLGKFYNLRGLHANAMGQLDSAIIFYEQAIEKGGITSYTIQNNLGSIHSRLGNYAKSISYYELGLEGAKAAGNIHLEASLSNNIGLVFDELGMVEEAHRFFERSIELRGQAGNERRQLPPMYNIVISDIPLQERFQWAEKGRQLAEKLDDAFAIQMFATATAELYIYDEQYQKSLDIALPLYEKSDQAAATPNLNALKNIVAAHWGLGNLEEALNYGLKCLEIAEATGNYETIQFAREHLMMAYEKQQNYPAYYEMASAYYPAKDSLKQADNQSKLAYLNAELEDVEQKQEIANLNSTLQQKESRRKWFTAFALLLGFIFILIIYFRNRQVAIQKSVSQELEVLNEELRSLDAMKSRFFTNISHELRTPLTLITTPVSHILNKYPTQLEGAPKENLETVRKNAVRLQALVEELLELSRLDAGKAKPSPQATALHPYCRQLFSAFESGAQIKNINYSLDYQAPEEAQLLIDRKRVGKIVNNLISNALKFTPAGGEVKVGIYFNTVPISLKLRQTRENSTMASSLSICVSDTGRGIPDEDLPHIFDRYFQTKNSKISREGGTGIGLALSKELANLMDGSLSVESEWGKGSTFLLRIPVEEVEHADEVVQEHMSADIDPGPEQATHITFEDAAIKPISSPVPTTGPTEKVEKPKILLVEDNTDMQQLISGLLSDHYRYVIAQNGAEAWKLLQEESSVVQDISLIISDVMMPEMDGYTLLEHIKAHQRWRNLPVIMLTARAAEEDKLQALRMGVDDYLTKPFSPEELLTRTANLINNYRERMAFKAENPEQVAIDFEAGPSADQEWLKELEQATLYALDKKIELNRSYLAHEMALSDRQLLRRLKAVTGLSIKQYINEVKLQKARLLLESKTYHTISEVAYVCGFNAPGYFATVYKKHFGKSPSEYFLE